MDTAVTDNLANKAQRLAGALRNLSSSRHRIVEKENEATDAEEDAMKMLREFQETLAEWLGE